MLTLYSPDHQLHHGDHELMPGQLLPVFEMPRRVEIVLERVQAVKLGEVLAPETFGLKPVLRVHKENYVRFLGGAWTEWAKLGRKHHALPMAWPVRYMNQTLEPEHIDARLGFFSLDGGCPITPTTWQAVQSSANVALSGAKRIVEGMASVFSLCRPPGHHSAPDYMGGYCFLNNAAIAAQYLRDHGAAQVAILDIDYHHGNGTQTIFYDRPDVLVVNLHGDPRMEYPFFLGHADEKGLGQGQGFNLNYPLPHGTGFAAWYQVFEEACRHITRYDPDVLIVSLGVDTYKGDPISQFRLDSPDYLRIGERIGKMGKPTLFVMEGGYAVEEIGLNTVNVLAGFEG